MRSQKAKEGHGIQRESEDEMNDRELFFNETHDFQQSPLAECMATAPGVSVDGERRRVWRARGEEDLVEEGKTEGQRRLRCEAVRKPGKGDVGRARGGGVRGVKPKGRRKEGRSEGEKEEREREGRNEGQDRG